jgi:hypothetical protein
VPTTIQDLLAEPSLGLELLVDGDLAREIRWVHVTELADASPYLVGDEFVLTAGVWRGRRHSAEGFVRALRSRDVAGIGYGLLVGDPGVPPAVVKACRENDVPLLVVPLATPFVAISQWFFERLAADRESALRATLALTSDLLSAAENSSAPAALAAVARILRRSTGRDVWIADAAGRPLAHAGNAPGPDVRARAVERAATGRAVVDGWAVEPVGTGSSPDAVIAVAADDPDDLEVRSRVDAARPVVGLVLARERAVRESERRLAGEVVSMVLGRQVEAAAARMPYYGLDPTTALLTFVCAVADREHALDSAERWLAGSGTDGVIALRGDELMLVVDGRSLRDATSAVAAATALGRAVGAVAVGTGSVADDVSDLRRSLVQARQACELGRRRGGGAVVSHELTGSHALLLALQDQDVLDAFRESLLAPMEDYDTTHGASLVATLRSFLETGGRWQESADLLHVHVNTLRNRLERVESLTGRRLDSTPDRVDLWLALQAHRPHLDQQ